jgi:hypothetical protein
LIGEACHIRDARQKTARYEFSQTDDDRSSIKNAIWLCSNCHNEIDKNKGNGYSAERLFSIKQEHEKSRNDEKDGCVLAKIETSGIGETVGVEVQPGSRMHLNANVKVFGIGKTIGIKIG